MSYPIHPAAECFPLIEGEAFDALVTDIKVSGLIEPIVLIDGVLVDGRNRLRACEAAGIEPRYRTIEHADPIAYITSTNVHRRHLTTQQRAAIAAELATMARGNASFGKKHNEATNGSNDPLANELSNEQAAQLMSVSVPSVKRAKQRKAQDPEAHEAVKRGEKPPKAAKPKPAKPKAEDQQEQEEQDMGNVNQTYRTIRKVARTRYTQLAGESVGNAFMDNNIKPIILERLEWTASHGWRKEITEAQADEVIAIVEQYVRERNASSAPKESPTEIKALADHSKESLADKQVSALDKAIAIHKRLLDMQMEERITERLQAALDMYGKEYDRYKEFNDAWKGFLTDDEYRLVISCLHPDRAPPERVKQYEKAFHIIKSKEDILLAAKPDPHQASMPRTVEELMARRKRH